MSWLKPHGTLDTVAYVHELIYSYGKLGQWENKCIFVRYSEHSKCYVFIGENNDGTISKKNSRDITFIENEFPKRGKIEGNIQLYELNNNKDQNIISQIMAHESMSFTPK